MAYYYGILPYQYRTKIIPPCYARRLTTRGNAKVRIYERQQDQIGLSEEQCAALFKKQFQQHLDDKETELAMPQADPPAIPPNRHVALDCEMVGVGHRGRTCALARVSIVDKLGSILFDGCVQPRETVVEYMTDISGIRQEDLVYADPFEIVQKHVLNLLQGKLVVGHNLYADFGVLEIYHPRVNIRDTSTMMSLNRFVNRGQTPSLKMLSMRMLGRTIQTGEHDSTQDAKANMAIFNVLEPFWGRYS